MPPKVKFQDGELHYEDNITDITGLSSDNAT